MTAQDLNVDNACKCNMLKQTDWQYGDSMAKSRLFQGLNYDLWLKDKSEPWNCSNETASIDAFIHLTVLCPSLQSDKMLSNFCCIPRFTGES